MSRPEDAEQTCHALNDSGQVLLYQNKAYLRPAEVAEMVLQALPDTTKDLEDKLTILQRELQPLEDTKQDVDKRAHMWGSPSGISPLLPTCPTWLVSIRKAQCLLSLFYAVHASGQPTQ